jgi:hypothetical protein
LVYMHSQQLDYLVRQEPSLFTHTFVLVYDNFRRWTQHR